MKRFSIVFGFFLLVGGATAYADLVPYSDPAGQGTQVFPYNLALTFNVVSPVTVVELGVFNASGTGFVSGNVQVAIFDTGSNALVTPIVTFSGAYTPGALGYDVFQPIAPVVLGPGSYEVDEVGLTVNGNLNSGSSSGPILNKDGGALVFTGAAYDYGGSLDDPKSCPSCQASPAPQDVQFDAGTFAIGQATPEPSYYGALAFGIAGLRLAAYAAKRRRRTLGR